MERAVLGRVRRICIDTETTGMSREFDRICEIGAVEIDEAGRVISSFHAYINPMRPVHWAALRVHGLSDAFLSDKPTFGAVAEDFIEFVQGAELYAHNMSFDSGFLNTELARCGFMTLDDYGCGLNCTLQTARRLYPKQKNNLDAVCARLGIDTSSRTLHGALLDSELLAEVLSCWDKEGVFKKTPAGSDF